MYHLNACYSGFYKSSVKAVEIGSQGSIVPGSFSQHCVSIHIFGFIAPLSGSVRPSRSLNPN